MQAAVELLSLHRHAPSSCLHCVSEAPGQAAPETVSPLCPTPRGSGSHGSELKPVSELGLPWALCLLSWDFCFAENETS